jgi:multidrug resistance efflux pump
MENNNIEQQNKEENGSSRNKFMVLAICALLVAGAVALFYLYLTSGRVYIEKSSITAPAIDLSSVNGGTLQKLFVNAGDNIMANEPIAQIGNDIVKSKDAGTVISVKNDIGKNFAPTEAVATMIKSDDLRVDAQVEEDKGLSGLQVGQKADFTADAFGSKKYTGIVDEISPTPRSGDVVFNISGSRQEQEFDVKIRFDVSAYPELKNGMSAKVWIYTK